MRYKRLMSNLLGGVGMFLSYCVASSFEMFLEYMRLSGVLWFFLAGLHSFALGVATIVVTNEMKLLDRPMPVTHKWIYLLLAFFSVGLITAFALGFRILEPPMFFELSGWCFVLGFSLSVFKYSKVN